MQHVVLWPTLDPIQHGGDGSSGGGTAFTHHGEILTGDYNGSNRVFAFPVAVQHNPPSIAVHLYHGGRRLKHSEFEIFESTLGGGLDRVRILTFIPKAKSLLFADFTAA